MPNNSLCKMEVVQDLKTENGQVVVSSRAVAERFLKDHAKVTRDIEGLIGGIAKNGDTHKHLFIQSEYQNEQNKQMYKEYLLTRDGFTLLAMGFTGKEALQWKLKYIEAFNNMENHIKSQQTLPENLSPQLQILINMEIEQRRQQEQLNEINHHALEAKATAEEANQKIQSMRDVMTLDHKSWREDARKIVVSIAQSLGGNNYIKDVWKEAYALLENRGKVRLEIKLNNRRKNILAETGSKAKSDKYAKLDVIDEDPRIRETFIAIIKEMAIKYGVA